MATYFFITVCLIVAFLILKTTYEEAIRGDKIAAGARSLIMFMLGTFIVLISLADHMVLHQEVMPLKKLCEENLPRSQECVFIAVPKDE